MWLILNLILAYLWGVLCCTFLHWVSWCTRCRRRRTGCFRVRGCTAGFGIRGHRVKESTFLSNQCSGHSYWGFDGSATARMWMNHAGSFNRRVNHVLSPCVCACVCLAVSHYTVAFYLFPSITLQGESQVKVCLLVHVQHRTGWNDSLSLSAWHFLSTDLLGELCW